MTSRDDLSSLVNKITFSAGRDKGGDRQHQDDHTQERAGTPRGTIGVGASKKSEEASLFDFTLPTTTREGEVKPAFADLKWRPPNEQNEDLDRKLKARDLSDKDSMESYTFTEMDDVYPSSRREWRASTGRNASTKFNSSKSMVKGTGDWERRVEPTKVEFASMVGDDELSLGTYGSAGVFTVKKYKLFCVGPDPEQAAGICGTLIGQGTTFCTATGCTIKHRTKDRAQIRPHGVYVKADVSHRAFCTPCTSSKNLEGKIIESWSKESQTTWEWARIFRLAEKVDESGTRGEDVTIRDLEIEEIAIKKAREMKTPLKGGSIPPPDVSPFEKYQEVDQALSGLNWDPANPQPLPYFNHFDRACSKLSTELEKLREIQQNTDEYFRSLATNHELRFEDISDAIGTRPASFDQKFDAPSLWGSIGNLGTTVNDAKEETDTSIILLTKKFDQLLKGHRADVQNDIQSHFNPLRESISELTSAFSTVANSLKEGIDYNHQKIQELKREQAAAATVDSTGFEQEIRALTERLENIESSVSTLQDNVEGAIKFHDLGFKSFDEGRAWLESFCPDAHFGFLIDFSTAMEHIQRQINGKEQLKTMHEYYKLKFMTTHAESVAISSFEYTVPRFFCETGSHRVHTPNMSYFSEIKGHDQWSDPLDGFKQRWKQELVEFKRAHLKTIGDASFLSLSVRSMCKVSLTTTVGWSLGLIDFIDNTYETYSQGKFGTKKAWHIASKLALCLIKEISRPRIGAINSFVAGKQDIVAAHIFWRTLQSLDKMSEVEHLDFENHPAISTELVKFLSMHTSVEAVEKLQSQHTDMVGDMKELKKEVGLASKNSSTNGNKVTEFGPKLTALIKRIDKLEKKQE